MRRHRLHIAVVEPSVIAYEGFSNLILRAERNTHVYWLSDLEELFDLAEKSSLDIIIINPNLVQNKLSCFLRFKDEYPRIFYLAFLYAHFDAEIMQHFHDKISIFDKLETITKKLNSHAVSDNRKTARKHLSEREIDVLVQLVNGLSNKEIAEELNISVHTVISHRKNIVDKTGIKSLPGLTIFAISQNISSVNSIPR